jgi:hypothetical protein
VTDIDLPVPIEALLSHGDTGIRLSALRCWDARNKSLPPQELIDTLMKDESLAVRHALLISAFEAEERGLLEVLAAEDESALIRRLAEQRLSEMNSPEP